MNGHFLRSSEGLGVKSLPYAPVARDSFPLVLVGSTMYMCGGNPWTADCYLLDTQEEDPAWNKTTGLLLPLAGHSGVAIGSNIWFVHSSSLFDYDTITGNTEEYAMPFNNADYHCSVANATHSYIVGVGVNRDEIWVNTNGEDPKEWTKVARLPIYAFGPSCVWFEGTIHIQGGSDKSWNSLNDAFALKVNSHSLQRLPYMKNPRAFAKAMILDCKPAVIGGRKKHSKYLASIETYDGNTWTEHELSLETGRQQFGLIQFIA